MPAKKQKAKRLGDLQLVENKNKKFGADPEYWFLRVQFPNGSEIPLLLTKSQILVAQERALANQEDLLEVGVLRNLLD